ncbi:MAG TPA: ABC transporter ATP-binding protein, partial [Candidatus Limiplasma sp.]|nr:ABC transporter ATP-binding protein [Candidatus Limiplasma sp.]
SYTSEQVTSSLRPLLIGEKTAKHGYTALLKTEDLPLVSIATTPADLETIMVHLEKEMAL